MKKFSVVIPYFQRQRGLLSKAVRSAQNQRGDFDIEIVVIDDESPIPARIELADLAHDNRIHIYEQKNAGCFGAGNAGIDRATGDYIAFLDSDDEWIVDNHLEHAAWAFANGYDFYFSDFYQLNQTVTAFNRAGRINVSDHPKIHPTEPVHKFNASMFHQLIKGNILGTSAVAFTRELIGDLRYLSDYASTGPEYVFWMELARRSRGAAFCSAPEARYGGGVNIFSESGWGTDKYLRQRHDEIRSRKYMLEHFELTYPERAILKDKLRTSRMGFGRGLAHNLLRNGTVDKTLVLKHLRMDPATLLTLTTAPVTILLDKLRGEKVASQ